MTTKDTRGGALAKVKLVLDENGNPVVDSASYRLVFTLQPGGGSKNFRLIPVEDYKSGYSLKELAKRYDCSAPGIKDFLIRKGVDIKEKYNILKNEEAQQNIINEYLDGKESLKDLLGKHHCSYNTFTKILSLHGIDKKGKGTHFKLSSEECLEVIKLFNEGMTIKHISKKFEVDKCTIYSLLKRYHINY